MARIETFFDLESGKISLFPLRPNSASRDNPYGRPDTNNPVFLGGDAESIRVLARLDEVVVAPTGLKFKWAHHVHEEHEISIERLWITRPEDGNADLPDDYKLRRNELMILMVAWQEPPPKAIDQSRWKARIYYGVTASHWNLESQEAAYFMASQLFRAHFFKEKKGIGQIPNP